MARGYAETHQFDVIFIESFFWERVNGKYRKIATAFVHGKRTSTKVKVL